MVKISFKVILTGAVITCLAPAGGADGQEQFKLRSSDGSFLDFFGQAAGLSGDAVIVGAPYHDDGVSDSGAAYVYRYQGPAWVEQAKLRALDPGVGDNFGISVGLSGDRAVVGAPYDDDGGGGSGSAYVFRYHENNWVQEAKLTASDPEQSGWFGYSVAISEEVIMVGAYGIDDPCMDGGAAYIFRHDGAGWTQEARLTASDATEHDYFGYSVAVEGDTAIAGAYGDDDEGSNSGAAYVFRYNGAEWLEEGKLRAADGAAYDNFGWTVSLSGDRALIAAIADDDNGQDSGAAYIFRRAGANWSQQAKLKASDGAALDYFGYAAALAGDTAVVGAFLDDDGGSASGSAYTYRYDGAKWQEQYKLRAYDAAQGDMFGRSAATNGALVVLGAPRDDDYDESSGSAYIFYISCPFSLRGDFNGNCRVDMFDFAYMAANWLVDCAANPSDPACVISATKYELFNLRASDGAANDWFGESVGLSGDRVIVGGYGDDEKGDYSGSAYVFEYNGSQWSEQTKLTASDGAAYDRFGNCVAIEGDVALAGAYADDHGGGINAGAVYVFRRGEPDWREEAKLISSDAEANDHFGAAVGLEGEIAIVGATGDDDGGNDSGSAYIFRYHDPNWAEEAKLTASDAAAGDIFGRAAAIRGNIALAGAPWDDDGGDDSGSVYVFKYNGKDWVQQAKLRAFDGAPGDYFGGSVGLGDDLIIAGAAGDDDNGIDSGSAYVFRYHDPNWVPEAKLTAAGGGDNDRFGCSVALAGATALVGAFGDDRNGAWSGSAYLFRYQGSGWIQQAQLTTSEAAANDYFGCAVALEGNVSLVGAYNADNGGVNTGSAYVFDADRLCLYSGGDINQSCRVDLLDLALLSAHWLIDCKFNPGDPACIPQGK